MASLINELICILEDETGCYQRLLDMADNKKDVIIRGDVPSLQEITKIEQELAGHILRLEKKRKQNLEDMCLVLGKKTEEMTISKLIDVLKGEEKERLKIISEALLEAIQTLQIHNNTNRELIEQSLEFVNFTFNAVQSSINTPVNNSYQAKGNRYSEQQGRNFFDAKQ